MTIAKFYRAIVPILMLAVAACGAPEPAEPTAAPAVVATFTPTTASTPEPPAPETATEQPTAEAVTEPTEAPAVEQPTTEAASEPTAPPAAEATQLSFTPTTYTDENAGFALDYPAEWTLDPSSQVGVRGAQALLLSPGTTVETIADGGSRLSLTTYIWDPKNDLDAYVTQRKTAWDASGFTIVREEQVQLADGRNAYIIVTNMPEQPVFNLLTTVGEDYLHITGEGDIALAEEIARTLRPLN